MRRVLIIGFMVATCAVLPGWGQAAFEMVNFRNLSAGGFHVYNVSAFSGYSTSAYPNGYGQLPSLGTNSLLGGDVNYGASASLGWQHHRERTDFSLMYFGSYAGLVRYNQGNGLSQSLAFSLGQKL